MSKTSNVIVYIATIAYNISQYITKSGEKIYVIGTDGVFLFCKLCKTKSKC